MGSVDGAADSGELEEVEEVEEVEAVEATGDVETAILSVSPAVVSNFAAAQLAANVERAALISAVVAKLDGHPVKLGFNLENDSPLAVLYRNGAVSVFLRLETIDGKFVEYMSEDEVKIALGALPAGVQCSFKFVEEADVISVELECLLLLAHNPVEVQNGVRSAVEGSANADPEIEILQERVSGRLGLN